MLVSIEGIIGAGKTTLCELLSKELGCRVFKEPIETWTVAGVDMLKLFYKDPKRNALAFELLTLASRNDGANKGLTVRERSSMSSDAFAKTQEELGIMTKHEYGVYTMISKLIPRVDPQVIVFIDTPVDECLARIRERSRPGEEAVTKKYLIKLKESHIDLLETAKNMGIVVIWVDGRLPKREVCSFVSRNLSGMLGSMETPSDSDEQ